MTEYSESLNHTKLVTELINNESFYCRTISTNRLLLEKKLLELYGFNSDSDMSALVFPSGMSAISSIINQYSGNSDKNICVFGNELYTDTIGSLTYTQKRTNFKIELVDVRNTSHILELFKSNSDKNLTLFYLESCTNPSGQIFDFSKIPELKLMAPNCIFVVDNTWTSACSFNPFDYGIDIVVESMTKYISGNSCIGGMIIGNSDLIKCVEEYIDINGLFVGSDRCQLFLNGLNKLVNRIDVISDLTMKIIKWMSSNTEIYRIMHPFMESHPSFDLANKFFKSAPGVIWFHLKSELETFDQVQELLSSNTKLKFETSYGAPYSKINPQLHFGLSDNYDIQSSSIPKKGIWIRLAIGYESTYDEIRMGLEELFEKNLLRD